MYMRPLVVRDTAVHRSDSTIHLERFRLLQAGTQMKVTCFNEAVEAFFDEIEVGCCYSIAEFTVKPANKVRTPATFAAAGGRAQITFRPVSLHGRFRWTRRAQLISLLTFLLAQSYNTLPSPYEIILQEESEVVMIDDGAVAESYNVRSTGHGHPLRR